MTKLHIHALAILPLITACSQIETSEADTASVDTKATEEVAATAAQLPAEMAELLDEEFSEFEGLTYYAGSIDLNGDNIDEWIAYVAGPGVCGTGGCTMRIFQQTETGIKTRGQLTVVQLPVGVFETSTEGWLDLAVTIGGGGIDYATVRVPYSDPAYVSNPTVPPAVASDEEFTTVVAFPKM